MTNNQIKALAAIQRCKTNTKGMEAFNMLNSPLDGTSGYSDGDFFAEANEMQRKVKELLDEPETTV